MAAVAKFSFFESFDKVASQLEDVDRLALFDAMRDFAFRGVSPEFEGTMALLWGLIEPNITGSIRAQRNGAKGGRGNASKEGSEAASKPKPGGRPKPRAESCPDTSGAKQGFKPQVSTDMDMDMDMEGEGNFSLEKNSLPPTASRDAAAAKAAPPAADDTVVPRCPQCGGAMRYDPSGRMWRCKDGACRATVKPHEISRCFSKDDPEPGETRPHCPLCDSRLRPPMAPGSPWDCPICGGIKEGSVVWR